MRVLGRRLTDTETDSINRYLRLLTRWQKSQRLVGSTDPGWLVENVVLDSLVFLRLLPPGPISIADLGSGAGLPGVPLKIVRPELRVVLIESRERRASFLSTVIRDLGLRDCRVLIGRAEDLKPAERGYDTVVMRCAGNPHELIPVAAALTRPGGLVIASGPPRQPAATDTGLDWIEVDGLHAPRRFALYRNPTS